jgi:hypothetical protein
VVCGLGKGNYGLKYEFAAFDELALDLKEPCKGMFWSLGELKQSDRGSTAVWKDAAPYRECALISIYYH